MTDNPALKDMFNRKTVGALADAIKSEFDNFPRDQFIARVFDSSWDQLALKARVRHITKILGEYLPLGYQDSLYILKKSLPLLIEQGFEKMVFPDFVEVYGMDDWETSVDALEEFTKYVSAEFAVRPLISRYPGRTLNRMLKWAEHPHPAVRRLASEGCRPRLPWGLRLNGLVIDPTPILPILEILKDDPREEIRRSVANNLNDISKDNPDVVIQILTRWQDKENLNRNRLIKHALRTLIKNGHPEALGLLGYSNNPQVEVMNISLDRERIKIGESVQFSFEIKSTGDTDQELMIDYLVHFLRANGKQSAKVFKLSQKTLQAGEVLKIRKKHSFQLITTRKYYPGKQSFQPQINGKVFSKVDLELKP